jgi:hypothetical protein
MTALTRETIRRHSTPIGQSHAQRYIGLMMAVGIVYPGAIMMQVEGEDYAQPAGPSVIAAADIVALANEIRTQYIDHIANTGGVWHTAADATNTVALGASVDLATAIALLNELRGDYEAHRVLVGGGPVHTVPDNVNAVVAPVATDAGTALALANDLAAKYDAHRTEIGVHALDDTTNVITVDDVTAAAGVCLGWADIPFAIDTADFAADGERKICIRDGIVGTLDNSAGADEVTDAHRNRIIYMVNDNTVSATDQGGTLGCPVRLDRLDSEGASVLIGREQV